MIRVEVSHIFQFPIAEAFAYITDMKNWLTYVSQQQGLPDVRHERHFKAAPAGCEYRLVVEYQPRQGFAGLFDRLLVKRSVERAMRKTVQNLDRVFQQRRAGT